MKKILGNIYIVGEKTAIFTKIVHVEEVAETLHGCSLIPSASNEGGSQKDLDLEPTFYHFTFTYTTEYYGSVFPH